MFLMVFSSSNVFLVAFLLAKSRKLPVLLNLQVSAELHVIAGVLGSSLKYVPEIFSGESLFKILWAITAQSNMTSC